MAQGADCWTTRPPAGCPLHGRAPLVKLKWGPGRAPLVKPKWGPRNDLERDHIWNTKM